ncbi:MAG: translation elongation factor aEF-1 beta [Candidatus Woesearchaeota archaeon]|jgi:translation elongation factor aEF-1 beta
MGKVVITARIMPKDPSADLDLIEKKSIEIIKGVVGKTDTKTVRSPIAFGLIALDITFMSDEDAGSPDDLIEPDVLKIEGVNSFNVTDVRRALG